MQQTDDLATWLTQIWDERELIIGNEIDVLAEFFPKSKGWHWNYGWSRDVWRDSGEHGSSTAPGAPTPHEVLARIAADRQILKAFKAADKRARKAVDNPSDVDPFDAGVYLGKRNQLEDVLKTFASAYADRSGYREEWRP